MSRAAGGPGLGGRAAGYRTNSRGTRSAARDTCVAMAERNADVIRGLYGFNWAAVDDRGRGLAAADEVMAPDVRARVSPEVGDRTLEGLEGFAVFVEGLEEDFSEFRYQAETFDEVSPEQVLVSGHIQARGRRSNMPLTAPFGHLWTLRDGRAVTVEARVRTGGGS
jgi:ketosteroid isomerase-like protein